MSINKELQNYPYVRNWSVQSLDIKRYDALCENWNKSQELILNIRQCIEKKELNSIIQTVAAAGSIGRMEASPDVSDADLIVVISNEIPLDSADAKAAYQEVWNAISELNLKSPKQTGVFAQPTNQKQLEDSIGKADESLDIFGKRLLLLLESQPIYNDPNYIELIDSLVERYAFKYVKGDAKKEWTLLLNDLIRYFRSLVVNYQWDFENEHEKWAIRNVKLRHSRIVMYGGLLMLLGEASKEREDKVTWLKNNLKMTPLERIAWVYEQNQDWNFYRIAGFYNVFLSNLNKQEVRNKLNFNPESLTTSTESETYDERYKIPEFSALKANSDALIAELLRFVLSRRGSWSERFFEYLLF